MNSMKQERMLDNVHLAVEVPLPSLIREQTREQATMLLLRHASRFGAAQLNVRLKLDGPQIACLLSLHTDDGRYHASATDWDVRSAVSQALGSVESQVVKRFEKRTAQT